MGGGGGCWFLGGCLCGLGAEPPSEFSTDLRSIVTALPYPVPIGFLILQLSRRLNRQLACAQPARLFSSPSSGRQSTFAPSLRLGDRGAKEKGEYKFRRRSRTRGSAYFKLDALESVASALWNRTPGPGQHCKRSHNDMRRPSTESSRALATCWMSLQFVSYRS